MKSLSTSSVKVGFGASTELKKLKTVQYTKICQFQSSARKLLIKLIEKIQERSPLTFKLTHYFSALSPTQIVSVKHTTLEKRFSSRLEMLIEKKWIISAAADRALNRYIQLIKNNDFVAQVKKFDIATERVYKLHAGLLSNSPSYLDVWEVVEKCVLLLHGNARVEENMKNASVFAHGITCDGIMKESGVLKIDTNKEMIEYVRRSSGKYKATLEKERSRQTEGEKRRAEKKRLNTELKQAITTKKKAVENLNSVVSQPESNIHALEKKLRAT